MCVDLSDHTVKIQNFHHKNSCYSFIATPFPFTNPGNLEFIFHLCNFILFKQIFRDFIFKNFYLFSAAVGLCCCTGFSLVAMRQGLLSSYTGFSLQCVSCCGARILGRLVSVVVVHGLSCFMAGGVFLDQGSNHVSCIDRWVLYHGATREGL